MEPHRSSYPDESEPHWHRSEQQQYAEPGAHARFETHVDEGGYRAPERRGGGRMPPGPPPGMGLPPGSPPGMGPPPGSPPGMGPPPGSPPGVGQPAVAWGAEALPPPAADMSQRDLMQHRDPTTTTRETSRAMGRPPGPVAVSTGIHRAKRPAVGVMIGIGIAVLALPVLRVLFTGAFGSSLSVGGVISSVLMLLALPLAALGLYGVATGAARIPDSPAHHAWLRPPVSYLTVALVLFVAAGLAAG